MNGRYLNYFCWYESLFKLIRKLASFDGLSYFIYLSSMIIPSLAWVQQYGYD